jgi:hypothetical protein
VERLEVDINFDANNEIESAKIMPKIYDAFKESNLADCKIEYREQPQLTIHISDTKGSNKNTMHVSLFNSYCHLNFETTDMSKTWLESASNLADKTVLLLTTYDFNIKSCEVEAAFKKKEVYIPLEPLVNDAELVKLVSKFNMPLTPFSLILMSKFDTWDVLIVAPKRDKSDAKKDLPTTFILHHDSPKYQESVLKKVYEAAIEIEVKANVSKAGDTG